MLDLTRDPSRKSQAGSYVKRGLSRKTYVAKFRPTPFPAHFPHFPTPFPASFHFTKATVMIGPNAPRSRSSIQAIVANYLTIGVENNLFLPLSLEVDMPFAVPKGNMHELDRPGLGVTLGHVEISAQ